MAEPHPARCDAVVIGAGISGLCAAGLLTAAGLRVRVFEEQPRPGGYLQGFSRGGFTFDTAIHWLNGLNPDGLVHRVLDAVGPDWPRCEPLQRIWRYRGDSYDYLLDAQPDRLCTALSEAMPEEAAGFARLFADCRRLGGRMRSIYSRMRALETRGPLAKAGYGLGMLGWYWPVRRLLRAPIDAGLAHYFSGHGPGRVFCAEERLAAVAVPIAWAYAQDYFAPPPGGSQSWIRWLVERIRDGGGSVECSRPVARVLLDAGRAAGVELADGERVAAPWVLACGDLDRLYRHLLPPEAVPPALLDKLDKADLYYSCIMLYCGLRCPAEALGLGPEMIRLTRDDVARDEHQTGGPERAALLVHAPSTRDPGLVPPGKGSLCVQVPAWIEDHQRWRTGPGDERTAAYREFKQAMADVLLDRLERQLIPGLRNRIERLEIATPITFRRYSANRGGSIMGAEPSDRNIKARLAGHRTPVPGLLLAGHWAEYGGGVPVCIKSAANASLLVLRRSDRAAFARLRAVMDGRAVS